MMLSTAFKSVAAAGTLGLGVLLATASGAAAHYTTTRCDADGDRCWAVRCDDDGDDCRRASSYGNYGYSNRYGYGSRRGYGSAYGNRDGHWQCDWDRDDCHWIRYHSDNRGYERDNDDRYRY